LGGGPDACCQTRKLAARLRLLTPGTFTRDWKTKKGEETEAEEEMTGATEQHTPPTLPDAYTHQETHQIFKYKKTQDKGMRKQNLYSPTVGEIPPAYSARGRCETSSPGAGAR